MNVIILIYAVSTLTAILPPAASTPKLRGVTSSNKHSDAAPDACTIVSQSSVMNIAVHELQNSRPRAVLSIDMPADLSLKNCSLNSSSVSNSFIWIDWVAWFLQRQKIKWKGTMVIFLLTFPLNLLLSISWIFGIRDEPPTRTTSSTSSILSLAVEILVHPCSGAVNHLEGHRQLGIWSSWI